MITAERGIEVGSGDAAEREKTGAEDEEEDG